MKIKSKLFLAFSSIVVLTIILGTISYNNADRVGTDFTFLVEHDLNVLQNAQELQKLVVDSETGQRGFVITGDENFLEPYTLGVSQFDELIEIEKELVSDNPSQMVKLEKIEELFEEWQTKAAILEINAKRVLLENPESLVDPAELLIAGTGKNILDQIRAEFKEFIEIENDLKNQRFLHALKIELETKTFSVGIIITIAGSATIIGFLLYRTISNPLTKLRNAAEIVTRGDYNVELKPSGSDELSDLTLSFSKMTKYLKSTQNDLKDRMIDLEQINERLIESELKFKKLYHTSPDMYRTINMDGIILDCNDTYLKKLGYSRDEVIGESIFKHVTNDSISALHLSFQAWKVGVEPVNHEVQMRKKDGESFPAFVKASNLYDKHGNLVGSNTAIRDVSEIYKIKRKYEEEKMKRLSVVGEMASQIAHDLRNPLSVIKNSIVLMKLKSELKSDEKTRKDFERIDRAVNRMNHQIEDVLDYIRIQPLKYETCVLTQLAKDSVPKDIPQGIKVNISGNSITVMCDPKKLESVFNNLITNAIQAIGDSGEININVIDNEEYVRIEFENSGPEIPKEISSKIFDPLFTTKQIGTGLGLLSCKTIVKQHSGKINFTNNPTTFVITIPKNGKA